MTQSTDALSLLRAVLSYFERSLVRIVRRAIAFRRGGGRGGVPKAASAISVCSSKRVTSVGLLHLCPSASALTNPNALARKCPAGCQANRLTGKALHGCRAIYKDAASHDVFYGS